MSFLTKLGLFAGGALFGTGGVAILSSKDAKKVYTECTAAVLRGKDCVVKQAKAAEMELAQAKALVEANQED